MIIVQLVDLDGNLTFEEAEADQMNGLKSAIDVKEANGKIYLLRETVEN